MGNFCRTNASGVIKLTKGHEYTYKLKVTTVGERTRIYGRINEAGELIFDLIKQK